MRIGMTTQNVITVADVRTPCSSRDRRPVPQRQEVRACSAPATSLSAGK
ncbi:MAG: hypothetical protein ACLSHC_11640 [Bilophila wadsworthia]